MKIQGVKNHVLVNGLKQLPKKCEIANAKLLNTGLGYYIAITVFIDKEELLDDKEELLDDKNKKNDLGIDFGCTTTLVCSNGEKFDVKIQESDRLKKLQRKLARQVKGSEGYNKTRKLIRGQYQKMKNIKIDKANKLANYLLSNYNIYMQDENLSNWKIYNGKSIQHSILGLLKTRVKPHAKNVLDKYIPTTKHCYNCGKINNIELKDRIYKCDCGISDEDRDIHAAKNMVFLSNFKVGQGLAELTRVDNKTHVNLSLMMNL